MSESPEGSIKIALIESRASDVALIRELVRTASVPADVADAMSSELPDLESAAIILIGLERLGPVESETVTRLHAGFPRIPMIVLAGPEVAARAGEALSLGAQHVILKSELTAAKLSSLIRYYGGYARGAAPSVPAA